MTALFVYMAAYLLPAFLLSHLALDVLLRNPRQVEHRLLSLFVFGYAMLFLAEFGRHLSPIEASPAFVTYWFGNAGILIFVCSVHFIFKVTGVGAKMPKWLYPYVIYLPLIPVALTFIRQENIINSQRFDQVGLWIYPEFNISYLTTMTIGNVFHFLIILLLAYALKRAERREHQRVLRMLILTAVLVLIWDIVFGYFQFRGVIPPYAYMYGGLVWTIALVLAMNRLDFLASYAKRYGTLYNLNPSAILLVDDTGRIESANPAARMLFHTVRVVNERFVDLLPEKKREEWCDHYTQHFAAQKKFLEFETKVQTKTGQERYVVIDGDFVYINQKIHGMILIRDVHTFKEAEQSIRFFAYHDPLTKLANRRAFYEQADQALLQADNLALVILDLDGFKGVNDTYGHQAGDDFLIHLGVLLEEATPDTGLASRVGGDEFYIYLTDVEEADIVTFVERLRTTLVERPFKLGHGVIPIRASIGVSVAPDQGMDLDTLIHKADQAMYQIKQQGKNDYAIYDDALHGPT
ncbi:diguanylate cyclase [Exiguobacterium sp. SH1S21]|uniref:GGDEF domain-containing protein n=1 Tax=Exiguobacterium sp. SH1S21 TaxID=2510953 RepID=UPI00103DE858|nr:diguanylate cyclase [Exiguobacterium sp. SH1S21]TCI57757.1 diguanylate cyclase [Exiguobacterium sp. SH1S21]